MRIFLWLGLTSFGGRIAHLGYLRREFLDQGPVGWVANACYGSGAMTDDVLLLAVVDDDADVRLALTRLMAAAGFAVETFGSGAEFLRWLNNHEPGCVILDLHMPEMSGADVQDALARRHPAVPVVVITGHDIPESRVRAMQSGASAYLCKPIDEDVLLEAIGRATGDVRG